MSQETYTKGGKEERGAEILPKLAHILGESRRATARMEKGNHDT